MREEVAHSALLPLCHRPYRPQQGDLDIWHGREFDGYARFLVKTQQGKRL